MVFVLLVWPFFPSRMRTEPKITSAALRPLRKKAANALGRRYATVDGRDGERYVVVVGNGRGRRHESHKQTTATKK